MNLLSFVYHPEDAEICVGFGSACKCFSALQKLVSGPGPIGGLQGLPLHKTRFFYWRDPHWKNARAALALATWVARQKYGDVDADRCTSAERVLSMGAGGAPLQTTGAVGAGSMVISAQLCPENHCQLKTREKLL